MMEDCVTEIEQAMGSEKEKPEKIVKDVTKRSSSLAFLLRHSALPDKCGWVATRLLADEYGYSAEELDYLVAVDSKGRFEFSPDRASIRAVSGHSIRADLGLEPAVPPPVLYHGTATKSVESILSRGILPMSREYVHLTTKVTEAVGVGRRHGSPVVLTLAAGQLYRDGGKFFKARNGVWLIARVAPEYIVDVCNY